MTNYEVGDTVNHKNRPDYTYEFLGVGYVDDRHYFRRTDDSLIVETAMPHTFEKHVPMPKPGEEWALSKDVTIHRHVLVVTEDYVIYNSVNVGSGGPSYLHVALLSDFRRGLKL